MSLIEINTKVLTYREYKGLPWQLRDAKKFEMSEATKEAIEKVEKISPERISPMAESLTIEVGGTAFPENYLVGPVIGVLRKAGWVSQRCVITIRNNDKIKGFLVHI